MRDVAGIHMLRRSAFAVSGVGPLLLFQIGIVFTGFRLGYVVLILFGSRRHLLF